jgi:hypothetical protein
LDDWYGDEFLAWSQYELPDLIATFEDGEAEGFADEAFYIVSFKHVQSTDARSYMLPTTMCCKRQN